MPRATVRYRQPVIVQRSCTSGRSVHLCRNTLTFVTLSAKGPEGWGKGRGGGGVTQSSLTYCTSGTVFSSLFYLFMSVIHASLEGCTGFIAPRRTAAPGIEMWTLREIAIKCQQS